MQACYIPYYFRAKDKTLNVSIHQTLIPTLQKPEVCYVVPEARGRGMGEPLAKRQRSGAVPRIVLRWLRIR